VPASLTIVPAGQTLTVNVYLANGSTAATCYTTADLTTAVTFPATVTSTTTYWVRTNDYYVVSALQTDGSEIANGNAGVWSGYVTSGAPRRIEPSPTYAQVAADDANLSGTYARSRRSVFQAGRKWLFVGTSITNGSNAGNVVYAFPQQATQMAGTYLASSSSVIAGTPGATVTQNAAALPALLTTHAPDAVFIETGPNIGGGTLSGFQDAVASMVAIVKATGAAVVVTTPSPVKGATATVGAQLLLRQYSLWLNLWGPANGVQVADFYGTLLDSTTGLLSATFDSGDDLHPNALGHSRLAQVAAAAMLAVSTSGRAGGHRQAGLTGGLAGHPGTGRPSRSTPWRPLRRAVSCRCLRPAGPSVTRSPSAVMSRSRTTPPAGKQTSSRATRRS
jgi:lysophospholipase L1-like esterase